MKQKLNLSESPLSTDYDISAIQTINKLKTQITSKTTELEKAKGELTLPEKQRKYTKYCQEQKERIVTTNQARLEEQLLLLRQKEEEIKRKIESIKLRFEIDLKEKLRYYDDEMSRITEVDRSTPKIRSLEIDLTNLWEELNRSESRVFGEPCSIKGWKRELPTQMKRPDQSQVETVYVEVEKEQRTSVSEKKGLLIVDTSEDEEEEELPAKKPISNSSASVFGKIIQSTKRVE